MSVSIGPKIGITGEAQYRAELKRIIQETKTLDAEMKAVSASFATADNKEEAMTKASRTLNDQIRVQRELVDKLRTAVQQSTKNTGENSEKTNKWKEQLYKAEETLHQLEGTTRENTQEIKEFGNETEQSTEKTNVFGSVLKANLLSDAIKTGFHLLAEGAKRLGRALKDVVTDSMGFDQSMSNVAATMGLTTNQIGDLRNYALEMGSTTAFSATEAADALNYMALAGYSSEQSMEALPNVLNLAAAGGIDLAKASDMVTDAQSALGLSMDESTELVDKMAKASSKSNTSVEQLGDAILTVGGTAKIMKGGTTELATALGILADNGIKGSEGGTKLRNMLLSLSAPTDQAKTMMDDLGISAYDADGNLRGLDEIMQDLKKSMVDMTQGEQTEVLNTVFNKTDLKAVNALLGTTSDRWEQLTKDINNSKGAAEKMAKVKLDNLSGDVTLFKSALEGAKIAISDRLTPSLRKFVQFGTTELSKVTNAFKHGGLKGAADQLAKSLSEGIRKISGRGSEVLSAVSTLIDSGINLVVSAAPTLGRKLVSAIPNVINQLSSGIQTHLPKVAETIGKVLGNLLANSGNIIKAGLNLAVSLTTGIIQGIGLAGKSIWEELRNPYSDAVRDMMEETERFKGELEKLPETLNSFASGVDEVDIKYREAEHWLAIYDELSQKTELSRSEQEKLKTSVEKLTEIFPELGESVNAETGKWDLNTSAIQKNIEKLRDRAKAEAYYAAASDGLRLMAEYEQQLAEVNEELNNQKNILNQAKDSYEKSSNALDELSHAQQRVQFDGMSVSDSVNKMDSSTRKYIESLGYELNTYDDLIAAWRAFTQATEDGKQATIDAQGAVDTLTERAGDLETSIKQVNGKIQWFFDEAAKYESEASAEGERIGHHLGAGLIRGMERTIGDVRSAAGGLTHAAINQMKTVSMIASPSKVTENLIGKNLGLGVIKGFQDIMDSQSTMRRGFSMNGAFEAMKAESNTVNNQNMSSINMGGISFTIYAQPGQDVNELADVIMQKMQSAVVRREAVFA